MVRVALNPKPQTPLNPKPLNPKPLPDASPSALFLLRTSSVPGLLFQGALA